MLKCGDYDLITDRRDGYGVFTYSYRTCKRGWSAAVTCAAGIRIKTATTTTFAVYAKTIAVQDGWFFELNGNSFSLLKGTTTTISNGEVRIQRTSNGHSLVITLVKNCDFLTGTQITLNLQNVTTSTAILGYINSVYDLPDSAYNKVTGMLGNFDEDYTNDIQSRDGTNVLSTYDLFNQRWWSSTFAAIASSWGPVQPYFNANFGKDGCSTSRRLLGDEIERNSPEYLANPDVHKAHANCINLCKMVPGILAEDCAYDNFIIKPNHPCEVATQANLTQISGVQDTSTPAGHGRRLLGNKDRKGKPGKAITLAAKQTVVIAGRFLSKLVDVRINTFPTDILAQDNSTVTVITRRMHVLDNNATTASISVRAEDGSNAVAVAAIQILVPAIKSVNPASATRGTQVTLTGTFGNNVATAGNNGDLDVTVVKFGNDDVTIVSQAASATDYDTVVVEVPKIKRRKCGDQVDVYVYSSSLGWAYLKDGFTGLC